jgi:hypothetical protein
MKEKHRQPLYHCESRHVGTRQSISFPFPKGGLRGNLICHYEAAKPGECMGMLGESSTGNGLRGSSIAIVKKKYVPVSSQPFIPSPHLNT